jgi:hypothetical protein
MFLDGPDSKARDAVHVLFASEKVRETDLFQTPSIDQSQRIDSHLFLNLDALVQMKLNVFRDKDRMHLRDMLDVELIDEQWPNQLPTELGRRLQELIDNPEDGLEGLVEEE